MLAEQSGVCAICGGVEPDGKRLAVDHEDVNGIPVVRGLLCGNCNQGIGRFRHDPGLLSRAITYLVR